MACPLRVKRIDFVMSAVCPVYRHFRTRSALRICANFRLMHCAEWRAQLGRGRVKTLAFSHAAQAAREGARQELQRRKEREVLRAQEALARQRQKAERLRKAREG